MNQESFKFYSYKVNGNTVILHTSKADYKATIDWARYGYYLFIPNYHNDILFVKLGVDKHNFNKKVLGYSKNGDWPYNKTKEDLFKILDELVKYSKYYDEY